jgi:hypothetical protein
MLGWSRIGTRNLNPIEVSDKPVVHLDIERDRQILGDLLSRDVEGLPEIN